MTQDQRDKLLDLHRAAVRAQVNAVTGNGLWPAADHAEDAYREYLFSLEVTQ